MGITENRNHAGPKGRWKAVGVAAITALALSLTGCAGAVEPASGTSVDNPLYEPAKAEGRMVWYTSVDPATAENTVGAFRAKYPGVNVEILRLTTGQVSARYSQERAAGAVPADVVTVGDPVFFEDGTTKGWFEKELDLPSLKDWPKDYYDDGVALVSLIPLGITYNTNLVEKEPTSWEDLLDPSFTGQLQFGDPRNVPAYMQLSHVLDKEFGQDFLKRVSDQDPVIFPSIVNATQAVGAGGAKAMLPGTRPATEELKSKGAPVGYVQTSPTVGVEFSSAISTQSTNGNMAKLFTDYLLSEEGQAVLNVNVSSPLGELEGTFPIPEGYQRVAPKDMSGDTARLLNDLEIR